MSVVSLPDPEARIHPAECGLEGHEGLLPIQQLTAPGC